MAVSVYSVICVYMWIFLFLQLHIGWYIWVYVWMCVGGQKLTWVLFSRFYESNFLKSLSVAWTCQIEKVAG